MFQDDQNATLEAAEHVDLFVRPDHTSDETEQVVLRDFLRYGGTKNTDLLQR